MNHQRHFSKFSAIALAMALPAMVVSACQFHDDDWPPEEDLNADVGSTQRPITGTLITTSCSTSRQVKLQSAVDYIYTRIGSSDFRECVKSAHMTEMHDKTAEEIIALVRVKDTEITCVAGGHCGGSGDACASVSAYPSNTWPEKMSIETDHIDSASMTELAASIMHEAIHTVGFNHPGATTFPRYPFTVPVQFATCIKNYAVDGWPRDQPMGDSVLSPVGNDSGQPFYATCPADEEVTGISVSSSSSQVNRMKLYCSDGSSTAWIGEYKDSTQTKTLTCASGSSLHRVSHYADSSAVKWMYGYCASNAALENDTTTYTSSMSLGGSGGGTYAFRKCPDGMAMVGATGRSGARIDQVKWLCEDIDGNRLSSRQFRTIKGSTAGNAKLELCSGNGVAHLLYGHAGGEVDQIGIECYPTTRDGFGNPELVTGNSNQHSLDYTGGTGGPTFDRECTNGDALVGLRIRSGSRIDAASAICADPISWELGSSSRTNLAMAGGSGGTYTENLCSQGEFLVGLKAWEAYTAQHNTTTVHGVQLVCRRID